MKMLLGSPEIRTCSWGCCVDGPKITMRRIARRRERTRWLKDEGLDSDHRMY